MFKRAFGDRRRHSADHKEEENAEKHRKELKLEDKQSEASRLAMPAAEGPQGVVKLAGHGAGTRVGCIAALPCGSRLATACHNGKVRILSVATGALEHELHAHSGGVGERALVSLGVDLIASGGKCDGRVATWDVATGEQQAEVVVGCGPRRNAIDGVRALAALGDERFVAGTMRGNIVFYAHCRGRDVAEKARIASAHSGCILDFAVCREQLATASADYTAAVWDVKSGKREFLLTGHTRAVHTVDMSTELVATGSADYTVRVYRIADRCACINVFDWIHSNFVRVVTIVDHNHILSAAGASVLSPSVCVTKISTSTIVSRVRLGFVVYCTAVLADGRLAVGGRSGNAVVIAPPAPAAHILKRHGKHTLPPLPPALRPKPVTPLQDAVARVAAGKTSAVAACEEFISPDACADSIAEWWAGHTLLMRAVRDGSVKRSTAHNGRANWWFLRLYTKARFLEMGDKDLAVVQRCIQEASDAGILEGTEAVLTAIISRQDLLHNVTLLQKAADDMVRSMYRMFLDQARTDRRLSKLMADFDRHKRVQHVVALAGVVFSFIPFAGAATAGVAGAAVAWDGMETTNVVESLLGIGVGAHAFVTESLVERFLFGGKLLLKKESLSVIPAEKRMALERAAAGLNMSIDELRGILASSSTRENGTEIAGISYGVESAVESSIVEEARTVSCRPLEPPSPPVNANALMLNTHHSKGGLEKVHNPESPVREVAKARCAFETGGMRLEEFVHFLKKAGSDKEIVSSLDSLDLSPVVAASLTNHEGSPDQLLRFRKMWCCFQNVFASNDVSGEMLADGYISGDELWELLQENLERSDVCPATLGLKAATRMFVRNVQEGSTSESSEERGRESKKARARESIPL